MKNTLILSLVLLAFSLSAGADTIIFKDGMQVEATRVWEENEEVCCEIGGIVFGYPKADVVRIEKGGSGVKKPAATLIKVHKALAVVPEKETVIQPKRPSGLDKKPAVPGKEAGAPEKKAAASKKRAAVAEKGAPVPEQSKNVPRKAAAASKKQKTISVKKKPAVKNKKFPEAEKPLYAVTPSFKEIINEDDSNPPVYIKCRRVLLVPRGIKKAQVRALLLSYEKKLRNKLNNRKAEYKLIVVWAYDDFERADEGAAGWLGMITNEQKSGELSDNPVVTIR